MMAKQKQVDAEEAEAVPDEPSSLEEATHAELLMMYNECALSIRFAKAQQWQSMGGILALFVLLSVYASYVGESVWALKSTIAFSLLASIGGIYSLVIYQFWQNTEREKLAFISERFSSTFRLVRGLTNRRESDFQRYVLLFFMVFTILAGNWLLILYVTPKLQAFAQ
ncbi:MAG TPA: hypothetical protein VM659_19960 [Dongiaceae bacterium]|nr:hypothetical protein [Dongiaceae bacterium]